GETYTVLIAFRTQDELKLAGAGNDDPIASSEVRTRWKLTQPDRQAAQKELNRSLTMAQRKRLSLADLIVLSPDEEGWTGLVERDGRRSNMRYCHRRGLMVLRSPVDLVPEPSRRTNRL